MKVGQPAGTEPLNCKEFDKPTPQHLPPGLRAPKPCSLEAILNPKPYKHSWAGCVHLQPCSPSPRLEGSEPRALLGLGSLGLRHVGSKLQGLGSCLFGSMTWGLRVASSNGS